MHLLVQYFPAVQLYLQDPQNQMDQQLQSHRQHQPDHWIRLSQCFQLHQWFQSRL